jgi:tetratricopeptide (TPR) repeat protein
MQTFGHTERFHLVAATGWLELGNWKEGAVELDQIGVELQNHPDVLRVRWALASAAKDWQGAVEFASALAQKEPEDSFGFIHQAYALHEMKRTREAWDLLNAVADKFPKEYLIYYNLACYACQLGEPDKAMSLLTKAFKLGGAKDVRAMALKDPDLAELSSQIKQMNG